MTDTATANEARSGPVRFPSRRSSPLITLLALALFAGLGAIVSTQPRNAFDETARAWVVAANSSAGATFFSLVSTVGSVTPMIVYAAIVVVLVAIHRRSMLPLFALFAPVVVVPAYLGAKSIFVRSRPSGVGNAFEGTYSFPSAHATTSSAICYAVAYLLYREGLVSGAAAATGATLICLVIGFSRVYLDVHWATDVIGGWGLGIAIGAVSAVLYDSAEKAGARTERIQ